MHTNEINPLTASLNVKNLTEIAEWLEAGAPHRMDAQGDGNRGVTAFDMSDFGEDIHHNQMCGTACCIAGSANAFHFMRTRQEWGAHDLRDEVLATGLLGLTADQAGSLFYPHFWDGQTGKRQPICNHDWSQISPQHAARVIRHLIATGDVDWNVTVL